MTPRCPRSGGDSSLAPGIDVVHAGEFRGGSHRNAEVDAPQLANGSREFPIPRLLRVMRRRRAQKFVARAVAAGAAVVHGRIPFLESDEQDEILPGQKKMLVHPTEPVTFKFLYAKEEDELEIHMELKWTPGKPPRSGAKPSARPSR